MKRSFAGSVTRLLAAAFFLFSANCGLMTKETKISYPNKVTPEMRADFDRVDESFKAKRYNEAEPGFQAFVQRYPYNELTDLSNFRLGQIQMLRTNYAPAVTIFDQIVNKTPDPAMASRSRVKAGICQYRLGNLQAALGYFQKAEAPYLQENDKVKFASLGLLAGSKLGLSQEGRAYFQAVLLDTYGQDSDAAIKKAYGSESPPRQQVLSGLEDWAKKPADLNQIDGRFLNYHATLSAPYVNFKLGMAYAMAGNNKLARKYLSLVIEQSPGTSYAQTAQATLEKMGTKPEKRKTDGKVYKVGVILPLTGKYQNFGTGTLNGMLCAASAKPGCSGVSNIQIITRDDQGDPGKATQAVDELVNQEKVVAIFGPLSSASAVSAAQRAQALGVVMISLAQKEGIPEIGTNIFRFSLTPDEQVKALLNYSAKKMNKRMIGILSPNSNYGKTFLAAMQRMATEYGAKVSASQTYGTINDAPNEIRQLKFSVSQTTPTAPLGFDSLFIPDSYNAVLKIAPHLKTSGLEKVLLLGTNAWNDPVLAQKSGGALGDSVFLDIYFKDSNNPAVKNFVQQYSTAFGGTPSTLEAMGYDVVRFFGQAVSGKKISNPQDVYKAVSSMSGYQGVTGLRSFSGSREARVEPYLLTVDGDKIKEVQ